MLLLLSQLLIFAPAVIARTTQYVFKPIVVDNLDVSSVGSKVGQLQPLECSVACLSQGEGCFAFHRSSAGDCFLLAGMAGGWPEKVAAPALSLWVRSSKLSRNCSAAAFPILRGRSRYSVETEKMNWIAAESNCATKGAKLAEVMSAAERLFIADFAKKTPGITTKVHIGFKQKAGSAEPAGGWVWSSTNEEVDQPWDYGQPNNYGGSQDYGAMEPKTDVIVEQFLSNRAAANEVQQLRKLT